MHILHKKPPQIIFAIFILIFFNLFFSPDLLFANKDNFVITREYGQFFIHIIDKKTIESEDWNLLDVMIEGNEARYTFHHKTSEIQSVVILYHPSKCSNPVGKGEKTFCIKLKTIPPANQNTDVIDLLNFITNGINKNPHPFKWEKIQLKHPEKEITTQAKNKLLLIFSSRPKMALIQFILISCLSLFLITTGLITLIDSLKKPTLDRHGILSLQNGPITLIDSLRKPTIFSTQTAMLIIVTIAAFAVRLNATPFLSNIRDAVDMGFTIGYGHRWAAGYSVYLHLLFYLFPKTHETVYTANIIVGAMTIPLLYTFIILYLKDAAAALAGAAILAFLPIHAKFSTSEAPHILLTFAYFSSLCFFILWAYQNKRWFLIQGLGWLVFMFNVRTDSIIYSLAIVFIVMGVGNSPKKLSLHSFACFFLVCLVFSIFIIDPVIETFAELPKTKGAINPYGFLINPFFFSNDTPLLFKILSLYGIGIAIGIPFAMWLKYKKKFKQEKHKINYTINPPLKSGTICRLSIFLLVTTFPIGLSTMFQSNFIGISNAAIPNVNYRYFLPLLATYSIFAGYGLKSIIPSYQKFSLTKIFIIIAAFMFAVPEMGFLKKTWTHQLEFEFIRNNIKLINNGCKIVKRGNLLADAGLEPSSYISVEAGRNHEWIDTTYFLSSGISEGCVVYYKSATCFARDTITDSQDSLGKLDELPECKKMKKIFNLVPIAETFLPALPYVREEYTRKPVPVGFYIVKTKMPKTGSK